MLLDSYLEANGVDDATGAVPVHLGCGLWGVLAVGLLAEGPGALYAVGPARGLLLGGQIEQLVSQAIGGAATFVFSAVFALVCWKLIDGIVGMAVPEALAGEGLDYLELGEPSYSD